MQTDLHAELAAQRRHIGDATSGMTAAHRRTAHPPTTWTPDALVHHLTLDVERWWFSAIVAGDDEARRYFDAHPGGAWRVPPGVDVDAGYAAEQAASDRILDAVHYDDRPRWWPSAMGAPQTVGQIVLHVIVETATHAGHLDIVRESIDGRQALVIDE